MRKLQQQQQHGDKMKSDWLVTTYDSWEAKLHQWVIKDSFEHDASEEAYHSWQVSESHDWTLTKLSTVEDSPPPKDKDLAKIISVLEQSDCVWTKYGSDTIEGLATKILNKIKGEN
jgi:hypothetical protein